MKSTGIVRKVDELGRIVIPIELRRGLGVEEKDPMEIFIDGNKIILQKYMPNEDKENVLLNLKAMLNQEDWVDPEDTIKRAIKLIK